MSEQSIIVYGADWCGDCWRAKAFFKQYNIPYRWVDIEKNKLGEQFVLKVNHGQRIIPTILFEDGSLLIEPSHADLAKKFKIRSEV